MKEDVLPEGWEYEQLSKKTEIILGQSPEGIYVNAIGKGVPFYQGKTEFGDLYPTVKNYCEKPKKIAEKNNVLLSVRAPVGPTNLATETTAIGRGLAAINCLDNDYKFILYQFRFIEPWLKNQGTGTTFQAITGNFIKNLKFIFPPLPEQQYLSQKLTALLDEVAQTKQRLEAIPALLKQFRQSVLADAVSGQLTDSDKYKDHKLKDYFNFIDGDRGPNYPKKDEYSDKGYCLFLSTKNVREFGFDFSECIYISQEKDSVLRKGKLNRDDVIITTRGTLGNVASYDEKVAFDNVRINSGMLILRKKENNILNEYSKILIASPLFKKMITDKQTGSAQPQLPAGILKEFEVPIPSIEQQTQIVQKVETYFALADEIETQVKAALENVNLLTQSILAKAFNGELSAAWRNSQVTETQGNV